MVLAKMIVSVSETHPVIEHLFNSDNLCKQFGPKTKPPD